MSSATTRTMLAACFSALLAGSAAAQSEVYTVDNLGSISLIDTAAGTSVNLMNASFGLPEGLALSEDNQTLYLVNSNGDFFTIDLNTLLVTSVVNPGIGSSEAMDLQDGRLVALSFSTQPTVYDVDPNTGVATAGATLNLTITGAARSLAMDSASTGFVAGYDDLYRVDLDTGNTVHFGPHLTGERFYGMDFVENQLIGIGSTSGTIYEIDQTTGLATPLGVPNLPSGFYLGMAAVPVPSGTVITGELTAVSPRFDRPRDTEFMPGPCGSSVAFDSFNDGQPYDEFGFEAIDPGLPVVVEMRSLEPLLKDFDPFLALYCAAFAPLSPLANVTAMHDDLLVSGPGTSEQNARIEILLDPSQSYTLVATSYASWAPTKFGRYELVLTNATATPPCPADINDDGILDNGDIGAFVAAFLAGSPAAEFNGDGILDNGDIGAFVAAFLAGC